MEGDEIETMERSEDLEGLLAQEEESEEVESGDEM